MIEAGVPDFVSDTWNAISAPPKTPVPIIDKLNRAVNEIIRMPDMQQEFDALNLLPAGGSPPIWAGSSRKTRSVGPRSSARPASCRSDAGGDLQCVAVQRSCPGHSPRRRA